MRKKFAILFSVVTCIFIGIYYHWVYKPQHTIIANALKLKEILKEDSIKLVELTHEKQVIDSLFNTKDTIEYKLPWEIISPLVEKYQYITLAISSKEASDYISSFPDPANDVELKKQKHVTIKKGNVISFTGFYHGSVGWTYKADFIRDYFEELGVIYMPNHVKFGCGDDKGTITLRLKALKRGKCHISIRKVFRSDVVTQVNYTITII